MIDALFNGDAGNLVQNPEIGNLLDWFYEESTVDGEKMQNWQRFVNIKGDLKSKGGETAEDFKVRTKPIWKILFQVENWNGIDKDGVGERLNSLFDYTIDERIQFEKIIQWVYSLKEIAFLYKRINPDAFFIKLARVKALTENKMIARHYSYSQLYLYNRLVQGQSAELSIDSDKMVELLSGEKRLTQEEYRVFEEKTILMLEKVFGGYNEIFGGITSHETFKSNVEARMEYYKESMFINYPDKASRGMMPDRFKKLYESLNNGYISLHDFFNGISIDNLRKLVNFEVRGVSYELACDSIIEARLLRI
ncbi:MAG: hypothetical protein ACTSVU_06495 [Promethearchaeota archaeon]